MRTEEIGAAGDGSGGPAGSLDDEISAALRRVDDEEAAWFVAVDSGQKVGMVFGELVRGEVNVRIWIHPDYRKRGYGTAALRKSRSEMAWCFPAVPMVVRAPAAKPRLSAGRGRGYEPKVAVTATMLGCCAASSSSGIPGRSRRTDRAAAGCSPAIPGR